MTGALIDAQHINLVELSEREAKEIENLYAWQARQDLNSMDNGLIRDFTKQILNGSMLIFDSKTNTYDIELEFSDDELSYTGVDSYEYY